MALFLYAPKEMVRLHVLADSDDPRAQRLKMQVVKRVRRRAAAICRGAQSADAAFRRLTEGKAHLAAAARRAARLRGYFGAVRVETGVFDFPERVYGGGLAPAGAYRAGRVRIGSGSGRNWWCVLYPELCAVGAACAQALGRDEAMQFYSSAARFFARLFGWEAGA